MSRKKLKLGITKTRQFRKKWKISTIKGYQEKIK